MEITATPHNTKRLYLYRSEIPSEPTKRSMLFIVLDTMSSWGGCDVNEEEYMSWEFRKELPDEFIQMVVKRLI